MQEKLLQKIIFLLFYATILYYIQQVTAEQYRMLNLELLHTYLYATKIPFDNRMQLNGLYIYIN